jgi:hypothetical protein
MITMGMLTSITTILIMVIHTPKAKFATTWSIRAHLRVRSPGER